MSPTRDPALTKGRMIHHIPLDLWADVKARAIREQPPGQPLGLSRIVVRLLRLYVRHGITAIESAMAATTTTPPTASDVQDRTGPAE